MRGKSGQRFVEIGLRSGGHTIAVLAEEDLVQIKLKDLVLRQCLFQPCGQNDLFDLALNTARAIKKKVLHHLLGNRRRPAQICAPADNRIAKGRDHARHVITLVGVEMLVLGRHKGLLYQLGDILRGHKQAPLLGEFVDDPAFARINPADGGRGILGKAFVARQV